MARCEKIGRPRERGAGRQSPEKPGGLWLEQQENKALRRRLRTTAPLRKVGNPGDVQRKWPAGGRDQSGHLQLGIGNSGKRIKSRRLSRKKGQSEKRVLSSTRKARNIHGSGDKEQAAEWPEGQARQPVWHPGPGSNFEERAGQSCKAPGGSVRKTVNPGPRGMPSQLRRLPTELPVTAVAFLPPAHAAFYCITDLCQHYSCSQNLGAIMNIPGKAGFQQHPRPLNNHL